MSDWEAIGDAATGAVIARTVEPKAGEADGHTGETNCLNCGTELIADYCHRCGQRAHVHRTIGAFFHDLLHGVFHFEGKIWRTLPMLAWRPGELTRRYVDGERARFVSPIALVPVLRLPDVRDRQPDRRAIAVASSRRRNPAQQLQREYAEARADSLKEMEELQAQRAELAATRAIDRASRRTNPPPARRHAAAKDDLQKRGRPCPGRACRQPGRRNSRRSTDGRYRRQRRCPG